MILMCRVCLTRSNTIMYDLTDNIDLDGCKDQISVLDALEKVTSVKVLLNGDFPQCICPMCISLLKMALKFITQFEDSQKKIYAAFNSSPTYEFPDEQEISAQMLESNKVDVTEQNPAPVEIIYGSNKFDLNDLIVVEEAKNDDCNFGGFLFNLGREVTATFADTTRKDKSDIPLDEHAVTILMIDNNNQVLPIKELKIDNDSNVIDYTVEENQMTSENLEIEDNDNIEYLEIDAISNKDIESLIIETTDNNGDEKNKKNNAGDTPRAKKIVKVGKRRKVAQERKVKDVIIMKPEDFIQEVNKEINEIEEDIFEKEIKFPCEICKKIFSTNKSLRAHKKRTHFPKERQFTCEICGYKNNTRSGYMHHKVKHIGKKFVCEICSKTYYTRAVLKVHMATHINNRQHLCNVCGKGFNYANALVYHMRLHTGEKNYKCEFCEERFRMPNALKRHLRIHTGERPYKCSYCGRTFCSKGEVSCHENIHTGFRPYHCKHCRKGFTKTHNLKLHLLSHEGPHKCEICGKSFIEMAILAMHYKISHRDLLEREEDD